jgi:hypothetical protein
MSDQLTCPHCRHALVFARPVSAGAKVHCAACGRSFVVAGHNVEPASNDVPVAAPYTPPPAPVVPVVPAYAEPRPQARAAWAILCGLALLAVGVAVVLVLDPFSQNSGAPSDKAVAVAQLPTPKLTPSPSEPVVTVPPPPAEKQVTPDGPNNKSPDGNDAPSAKPPAAAENKPPVEGPKKESPAVAEKHPEKPPTAASAPKNPAKAAVPLELQKQIDRAIGQAVSYLRGPQAGGSTFAKGHPVGYASLSALTLLECGVPKDDAFIRSAAAKVRSAVQQVDHTYDLSLAVLFLDKLGDPEDKRRIQLLAVRILAGQNSAGGWSYLCPREDDAALLELLTFLRQEREFRVAKKKEHVGKPLPVPERFRKLAALNPPGPEPADRFRSNAGDNSNTQFALLALWAARRYDIPLERTFALAERRFRSSQNPDGGWGYYPVSGGNYPSTKTMTCAGLLGLAIGRGFEYEQLHKDKAASGEAVQKLAKQDAGIQRGLKHLGAQIGSPTGGTQGLPFLNLYFLWSVERVAVLYGLTTIGDKDWYRWGSEILLANQQLSGCWADKFNPQTDPSIDTCFALLFLKRANLAPDLTENLRLYIPVVDPDRRSGRGGN